MAAVGKMADKRTVEVRVIGEWVERGTRVLDLGCGRGVLLEYLVQTKGIHAVGVDFDFDKVAACVKRGLTAYQGDLETFLREFPDGHFDRVIFSRTLEELAHPDVVIRDALRVGRCVTVGFVNHAYWRNRVAAFFRGRKPRNEVYTATWSEARPSNPLSVADFESYCASSGLIVRRKALLRGDWKRPCRYFPNLHAGYAVYEISR